MINLFRLKLFGYGGLMVLFVVGMVVWMVMCIFIEVFVICDCNVLYCVNFEGLVENLYILLIINKI